MLGVSGFSGGGVEVSSLRFGVVSLGSRTSRFCYGGAWVVAYCRNLIKKPWAFIRVPYMHPTILVVLGPGFLNQVPTLL